MLPLLLVFVCLCLPPLASAIICEGQPGNTIGCNCFYGCNGLCSACCQSGRSTSNCGGWPGCCISYAPVFDGGFALGSTAATCRSAGGSNATTNLQLPNVAGGQKVSFCMKVLFNASSMSQMNQKVYYGTPSNTKRYQCQNITLSNFANASIYVITCQVHVCFFKKFFFLKFYYYYYFFLRVSGRFQLQFCEPGRFASENGTADCTPCVPGSFSVEHGVKKCDLCPKG